MAIRGALKGLRARGTFNIRIQYEGNWIKYNAIVNNMDILLVMATRKGQKEFAEEYRDRVKFNIRTGGKRFGYPQNAPDYLKKKASYGGGTTALVWSGTFLNAVGIIKNRKGTHWGVGVPKGIKRPSYSTGDSNRLQVHEIANISEHGIPPRQPARPVFRDTFNKDMGGKRGLKRTIEFSIMKNFGTKSIRVNKI